MPTISNAPITNRLLAVLPGMQRERFLAACEPVTLEFATILAEPGEPMHHVYFPIKSFISLVAQNNGRPSLEVAMIGNEGMLGVSLMLGIDVSPLHALVQGTGAALRMDADVFCRELEQNPALHQILQRYLYVEMSQFAQTAACTRFHVVEARLARWLLMTQDRAHSTSFHATHAFLAYMLGVRRVGITTAATSLHHQRLISYSRGYIKILNRHGLEAISCSCYAADLASYDNVMGWHQTA